MEKFSKLEKIRENSMFNSIFSGACSGALAAVLFQPLEFIKTKLQQPTYSLKSMKSYTIRQLIIITLTDKNQKVNPKNVVKFWSGLTPSLIRSVPVVGIYFGCIDTFKNLEIVKDAKVTGNYQIIFSFIIGSVSKVIADVTTYPLYLIKTRYESEAYKYKGVCNAVFQIIKSEGFSSLYKGLNATLARDISYSGIYYTLYTKIKQIARERNGENQPNETSTHFAMCALVSSVLACALTQPPDIIRAYIQLDPKNNQSIAKTARNIYAKKGMRGFWAGFIPRSVRRVMMSVMSWTLYEKLNLKTNSS